MQKPIPTSSIPTNPGCYLFKNKQGFVIYIGKAKNLRKRVSSYFTKTHADEKTQLLVTKIADVDFIITKTEKEALILENNLINKYKPRFNIDLRHARRYAFLLVTDEPFPRIITARDKKQKGTYFGPFTSAAQREQIRKTLTMIFRIRTCKRLPKRVCLRYHMKLCDAPCTNNISQVDYNKQIDNAKDYLNGKVKPLIKQIKQDMKTYSLEQEYEQAMLCRDQVRALEYQEEKQLMERQKKYNQDIIHFIIEENKVHLLVFNITKGMLINKKEFEFDYYPDFFEEFIMRFYEQNPIPKEIIVPTKTTETLSEVISEKKKQKVTFIVPKRGENKQLLDLVLKNIEVTFKDETLKLEALRKALKLQEKPHVIECFDISHTQGTEVVASMVQFRNAKPDKSNYRRFKIKNDINDDFANMAEVVRRRYQRLTQENKELPDLIVIDGGKGQLSASITELRELGLKIPTIALAKKQEDVFVPGLQHPLQIKKDNKGLLLLQHIRNEAHRFAVKYHRLRRDKRIREK